MSDRYDKQRRFAPIGEEGQDRLDQSTAVVVGCGALGALASEQLVRAGVGRVRIVDRDFVEHSNLQRQVLFTEADAAARLPKAVAAAEHLRQINSDITIEPVVADVSRSVAAEFIAGSDVVIDGTDNLETRYLLNEVCLEASVPWVYGGCVGAQGQAAVFAPPTTPCLRCLFPDLPAPGETETCDTAGVIAPAAHLVASLQTAMAFRVLVEGAHAAGGKLLIADVWEGDLRAVKLPRGDGCPTCSGDERPFLRGERGSDVAVLCGRNAVQISAEAGHRIDFEPLAARLASQGDATTNPFLIRFEPTDAADLSLTIFRDGRVIVQGTEEPAVARTAVARYVGT